MLRSWTGSSSYRFSRSGTVESDSVGTNPVLLTVSGTEVLSRTPTSRGITFLLGTEAGATARGRRAASATISNVQIRMERDSSRPSDPCDPVISQLRGDLADLAFPLGAEISLGEAWSDSVTSEICISGLSGMAETSRRFTVVGDTTLDGSLAILVARRDSTALTASGPFDQHTVSLTAVGTTAARVYLSESTGRVVLVKKVQLLRIDAATASGLRRFTQKTTSAIEAVR